MERKRQVRAEVRRALALLASEELREASGRAVRILLENPLWQRAGRILAYCATGHELDLWPALEAARKAGKAVALPRYDAALQTYCAAVIPEDLSTLTRAGFGILEPPLSAPCIPLNQLDLVLVPGLAFDLWGRRLGRGKGFYDRLLAQVNAVKCGVALDQQIVEELPAEPHDIAMNTILTPTRWLVVPSAGS
jgi:5-formyltetrahydrofolate cyclo-ligase